MDRNRYTHEGWTAGLHWTEYVPETMYAGGKPSRGTPADHRLKENQGRGMPPRIPAPMPKPGKPGGGKPGKGK